MIFRKLFMCWSGFCGMVRRRDDTHLWAECPRCGKTAAKITREAVRRYLDAERARAEYVAKREAARKDTLDIMRWNAAKRP